ncbi:MAG: D-alanyl-D-alanine carboxypeptidase family protein [Arenicella sp.]
MKIHISMILKLTMALALYGSTLLNANAAPMPEALKSTQSLPELSAKSWVLLEPVTGWVIASENADMKIEPASLTKLMTIYLAFSKLASDQLQLDEKILISKKAWQTEGSRMFAEVNDEISLLKILKSIIIQSGNDASVALAEHIAGTEDAFADMMNETASSLQLTNTNFKNSTGLPDKDHYSSAYDIARLSAAIIQQFPQYYAWFSAKEFTHNNIVQNNRNRLLWRSKDVDGLKTGHTEAAGYCLAATSKKDDLRVIAVVTGTNSDQERSDQTMSLLRYGHSNYSISTVLAADESVKKMTVYGGETDKVNIIPLRAFPVLVPKGQQDKLSYNAEMPANISAPIDDRQTIGIATVQYQDKTIGQVPLVVAEQVPLGSLLKRTVDYMKKMVDDF